MNKWRVRKSPYGEWVAMRYKITGIYTGLELRESRPWPTWQEAMAWVCEREHAMAPALPLHVNTEAGCKWIV